jgi:predicted RNA-binding Zn ribbon-like protein
LSRASYASTSPTPSSRGSGHPRDYLASYADLVAWSRHAGVVPDAEARQLSAEAERRPDVAHAVFAQAMALREAIYRSFLSIARSKQPDPRDLDTLHAVYAQAMAHARLAETGAGFDLVWAEQSNDLARPLWPIARSAVELLMRGDPGRIKDCLTGGDGCGWLFYDTSKNNSRRWCSMRGCGNPAKERRRAKRRSG